MESNHEQLVKALRHTAKAMSAGKIEVLRASVLIDAADAIETLQKRLVNALTALHLANEKMGYYGIQPYTEADGEDMISDWVKTLVHEELTIKEREYEALKADRDELATDLAAVGRALTSELEQQLPKRGEWVWKHRHHGGFKTAKGKCECGRDVYAQIDERYETDDPYCPFCGVMNDSIHLNYCPNCGADMRAKMEGRE